MMTSDDLKQRIEAIETGYEFMLASAALGGQQIKDAAAGRKVREILNDLFDEIGGQRAFKKESSSAVDPELPKVGAAFFAAVESDARIAIATIRLVLARADISSQLIDNLNASIHLRALLTDLFVVDEALKPPKARG
jgi:hypothetical protein